MTKRKKTGSDLDRTVQYLIKRNLKYEIINADGRIILRIPEYELDNHFTPDGKLISRGGSKGGRKEE